MLYYEVGGFSRKNCTHTPLRYAFKNTWTLLNQWAKLKFSRKVLKTVVNKNHTCSRYHQTVMTFIFNLFHYCEIWKKACQQYPQLYLHMVGGIDINFLGRIRLVWSCNLVAQNLKGKKKSIFSIFILINQKTGLKLFTP